MKKEEVKKIYKALKSNQMLYLDATAGIYRGGIYRGLLTVYYDDESYDLEIRRKSQSSIGDYDVDKKCVCGLLGLFLADLYAEELGLPSRVGVFNYDTPVTAMLKQNGYLKEGRDRDGLVLDLGRLNSFEAVFNLAQILGYNITSLSAAFYNLTYRFTIQRIRC